MSAIKHIARLLIPLAVLLMAMDTPLEAAQTYENHVSWSPPKVMYAIERSNVRAGPGTSYDKVDLLEVGQEVRVSERTGSWFKLEDRAGQRERFVYAPLLTATKLTAATIRNFSFPDGARYRGHARDGKPHGRGVYSWANGDRYEGNFVNGKRTGRGVHTWANGDRYEGEFVNGKRTGRGVYTWANGDRYEGEFVNGKLHGRGVYTLANGDRYEGVFVDGKRIDAQAQEGGWGAIFWTIADERWGATHNIPFPDQQCHHVAGMTWNYQTKRETIKAARDACREEWPKSGTRARMTDGDCGDLQYDDPIGAGTVLGVIFGPGQCAAYATGRQFVDATCPISGTGVGASKSEAARHAVADCEKGIGTCQVTMSSCNSGTGTDWAELLPWVAIVRHVYGEELTYGIAWGHEAERVAYEKAHSECVRKLRGRGRGSICSVSTTERARCIAVSHYRANLTGGGQRDAYSAGVGHSRSAAEKSALKECYGGLRCRIVDFGCAK